MSRYVIKLFILGAFLFFGMAAEISAAGGYLDIAIYRTTGANGAEWWVQRSSTNQVFAAQFGAATDKAVGADYTGDGKTNATVFRPSTNTWYSQRTTAGILIQNFGQSGDMPVPNAFVP